MVIDVMFRNLGFREAPLEPKGGGVGRETAQEIFSYGTRYFKTKMYRDEC